MNFSKNNFKVPNSSLKLVLSLSLLLLCVGQTTAKPAVKAPVKPLVQQKAEPKPAEVKKVETPVTIKNQVTSCPAEISLEQLVGNPETYLNKEVCFNGVFSAFSALALDYPPAMRERKKYISLTLFRPNTKIPLGELKLAMKIDEAQKHESLPKIAEGDSVKVKGKMFSTALGEPWLDVVQIQVTKDPKNKDDSSTNAFDEL